MNQVYIPLFPLCDYQSCTSYVVSCLITCNCGLLWDGIYHGLLVILFLFFFLLIEILNKGMNNVLSLLSFLLLKSGECSILVVTWWKTQSKLYLLCWRCFFNFRHEVNVSAMFEESDKMLTLAVLDNSLCSWCISCISVYGSFVRFYINLLFRSITLNSNSHILPGHSCGCYIQDYFRS